MRPEEMQEVPEEQRGLFERGGYFDFKQVTIRSLIEDVAGDPEVRSRYLNTARLLGALNDAIYAVVQEMDVAISEGDKVEDNRLVAVIERVVIEQAEYRAANAAEGAD